MASLVSAHRHRSPADIVRQHSTGASARRVTEVAGLVYPHRMPDDLYDRDILAWSERQAELLRRLSRGERVNELDWEHVVEEIEDVGLSELHAVQSYLEQILVHLLKTQLWPSSDALNHWRAEIVALQGSAERRFAPSMEPRIDLANLYKRAIRQVATLNGGQVPASWPQSCPFALDALLRLDWTDLEQTFQSGSAQQGC